MTRAATILVTGASGFIGRHLLAALLEQQRSVIALCRHPGHLTDMRHPALTVVQGDVEQADTYRPHLRAGVSLIHLAAVRPVIGVPAARFAQVNVAACVALGRAALAAGVERFVYVSTALIFGPADGDAVDECREYRPAPEASAYVRTRVRAAVEMRRLADEGLALVTVCPAIVFGPDEPTHPNRLAAQARRLAASGVEVVIGGGTQRRTLVDVADVVQGILQAEEKGAVGEAYILGGEDWSHREFNQAVLELAGRRPRLRLSVPLAVARVLARSVDRARGYDSTSGYAATVDVLTSAWRVRSDKAARVLGYRSTPVREALRRMLGPERGHA